MSVLIEVCIDSIESLSIAQKAGAGRIELCSSLATGGLTPSAGYMKQAVRIARVPVYAIIRARAGDFLFSSDDIEIMLEDIHAAKRAKLNGVVIGALQQNGNIDCDAIADMIKAAGSLGVTFHRAIDHCATPFDALEFLMSHGVERVLSSGLASSAEEGIETLKKMVVFCGDKISIMPGAGVSSKNVRRIMTETGAIEVHLSGKTTRATQMNYRNEKATMGASDSDFFITVTDFNAIEHTVNALRAQ